MTDVHVGSKRSLDSVEDSLLKRQKTYVFDGQSTIDYATRRSEIESLFLQNNCSELVSRGSDEVPVPTETQRLLTETTFSLPEPTREIMVVDKLTTYTNLVDAHRDQALAAANNNAAIMANASRAELIREINSTHLNRMFDRIRLENDYEKSFQSALSDWETRKSRFETKKASCAKVFAELFSPSALGAAKEFVERGEFRRALFEMDRQYASESASVEAQGLYLKMLTTVKFNGNNLKDHLASFNVLGNQVVKSGHTVNDTSKYLYLADSIQSGNNRSYDDIINISSQMSSPEPYSVLLNKLIKRYDILNLKAINSTAEPATVTPTKPDLKTDLKSASDLTAKEFRDFINNIINAASHLMKTFIGQAKMYANNANNNNTNRKNVSITCSHCNQPGHTEARCWSKVPCSNCGVIAAGHNPFFCARNQSANNVSGSSSDDTGTKVELLGNFKKKWGTKK